jgi:multidrug efflux pump subunit AcrB
VTINGKSAELMVGETLYAPAEIGNLLITTRDGRPVYVRDLADIAFATDSTARIVATVTRSEDGAEGAIDRKPAVTLAIAKRAGANAVLVAEQILERTEALEGIADSAFDGGGSHPRLWRDGQRESQRTALPSGPRHGVDHRAGLACHRLARGAGCGDRHPGHHPADAVCLAVMGYTLNRVSLFALIFSIGILVDDAIVVIENIARHWGMGDGRERKQAAIEAVAEVGNPTIVATLTVVAALLPMLFVSGMMGPYMSPIPANASAAMVFSFFVAVMVTPWLMLKIAGRAPMHHGHARLRRAGGVLGRIYRAVARPVLASKTRAWIFLMVVGVLTLGSLSLFYTKDVTVKLLPFDNKSELSVVIDMPEGTSVEATDAVAQAVAREALKLEEVKSVQTHAGTAAPFNFNGLVRHSFLRSEPRWAMWRST